MINLFIDSNIWLSLYYFTSDDLTQFSKLKDYIGNSVKLFIPQQVCDEVLRNRETKIQDAFISFKLEKIQFPAFCKEYPEYEQFSKDYADLSWRYKQWKQKIDEDVKNRSLPADQLIESLFSIAGIIPIDQYIEKAFMRYRIGNPPGKDNKYGDAINWECLLDKIPNSEDIYFVSSDKDYRSRMFDKFFNPFLSDEWNKKKGAAVHYYQNLVSFLRKHIAEIQLKTEQEKEQLIDNLRNSPSFVTTHGIITMLNRFTGWSDSQIEGLCEAVIENTQVKWIIGDDDVFEFYSQLLSGKRSLPEVSDVIQKVIDILDEVIIDKIMGPETANAEAADQLEEYYEH